MEAIIDVLGQQIQVKRGETYLVPHLQNKAGDTLVIDKVLSLEDKETGIKIGQPYVKGARVTLKVIGEKKGDKVTIFKFKKRKNYRLKKGHRQLVSEVLVEDIKS